MMSNPDMRRMLSTHLVAQHKRRTANFHRLMPELGRRSMTSTEISEFLSLSLASGRKYRVTLQNSGLVETSKRRVTTNAAPQVQITLKATLDQIVDFLTALDDYSVQPDDEVYARPTAPKLMPGTRIIMAGDETNMPRRNAKVTVQRDPLDVAFFGPAQSVRA